MKQIVLLLLFLLMGYGGAVYAQNLPEQECIGAIPVCQSVYTQSNSYSGHGVTQELNLSNHGCLGSNERNDVWYVINVSSPGELIFFIRPNAPSDYDFAVWNITGGGCQQLYNGLTPVRCDFAGGAGRTGLTNGPLSTGFQPSLNVNAGETYLLNVSNFSPTQTGYLLSFSGSTASIFDNLAPHFVAASTTCGTNADTVKVLMSEAVLCSSIAPNGSDFTLTPAVPGVSILSATAPGCGIGGTATLTVNIKLSGPLPSGNYTLKSQVGTDTNTIYDNCTNAQLVGDSVNFVVGTPPAPIFSLLRPAQCGQRALFSITPPVGGIYTLTIKQGATTLHTFNNLSGAQVDSLFPGTYTATLTSAGCSGTVSFTLVAPTGPPVLSFAVTPTCAGGASGAITATVTGGSAPWIYNWNTVPVSNTQTITGIAARTYTLTVRNGAGCVITDTVRMTSVPNLPITVTKTNASCNGLMDGTATVDTTNGTAPPYTYLWNTTPAQTTVQATGLGVGTYTVSVTDTNSCVRTGSAVITQPSLLIASATATTTSCSAAANGTATAAGSGGTGPYTYVWNTTPAQTTKTATGLNSGTYVVTVSDSHNCSDTASVFVPFGSGFTGVFSGRTLPSCFGGANGSLTFVPSGGLAPYTYIWNNGQTTATATGLAAGPLSVTVTDANGCSRTDTTTLGEPTLLQAVAQADSVSCFGGNTGKATVVVSGGTAPYSHSWNTTPVKTTAIATGLISGNYQVTVTDAKGCTQTASTVVSEPTALSVTTGVQAASCPGVINGKAYAVPVGGTPPYTYRWNTTPVQTTDTAFGLLPITYTVKVTDSKGCNLTQAVVVPGFSLSVAKTDVSCNGLMDGSAMVTPTGGIAPYTYSWNTTPVQTTAVVAGLSAGTYIASVTDANGCTISAPAFVGQPTALAAAFTIVSSSCTVAANGSVTVTASGGKGFYTYLWNTNPPQTSRTITGLLTGTYTITIKDTGNCTATFPVIVPAAAGVTGVFSGRTLPSCFGGTNGSVTFVPSGGLAPYTYIWNNGQTTATATGLAAGPLSVTVTDANGCSRTDTTTLGEPTLLQAVAQADSVSCFGGNTGKATVVVSGGTAPYSYSWNTTPVKTTAIATGLISGNYQVTVTDAKGCTQTANAVVSEPTALSVTTGVQAASCPGVINGKAYAVPVGGTPPYTYRWNTTPVQTTDTAFGLLPITYTVKVTDSKGCNLTQAVVVPGFSLSVAKTDASCNGLMDGSATVTPTGGIAPYTYSWNTTPVQTTAAATGLSAGTYIASVTDANGCTITKSAVITQPAALVLTPASTPASCGVAANGTATVAVSGGVAPYTYSWNTTPVQNTRNLTGLTNGVYTVTVQDGINCAATASVTVSVGPGVSGSFTQIKTPNCFGDANGSASFTPAGGVLPYTYAWSNGQTTAAATGLTAGPWSIVVTDANGCSYKDTLALTQPTALQGAIQNDTTNCFGGQDGSPKVVASGGTSPYTYSWNTTPAQTTATATGLAVGNYSVTVTDAKGCTGTYAAVVRQPTILSVSTGVQGAACPGSTNGKAYAMPSGGTAPYTYSWNTSPVQTTDTAFGLLPGTYTVKVTDRKGCNLTQTVVVTGFSISVVKTNASCNSVPNGSATVTTSNGRAPFSYSWNTTPVQTTATATGLGAGTYIASVTDANGCVLTATATITQPSALIASVTTTASACSTVANGTATVIASGGVGPYTYSWNTTPVKTTATATGLIQGSYTVTVRDANNCTTAASVVVPAGAGVTGSFTRTTQPYCFGGTNGSATFTPTGGTAPYTYLWSNGQATATAGGLAAGSWNVTVTDVNGCSYKDTFILTQPTALQGVIRTDSVACFGNATGSATISASGGTSPYTYLWNTIQPSTDSTATGLSAGNYQVVVTDAKGCTKTYAATVRQPTVLSVAVGVQKAACPGSTSGKVYAMPSGGKAPYTYSWNTSPVQTTDTASGLVPGTYLVTITDSKGCTASNTITLPNFSISTTQTNASCNGGLNGSATVTTSNGRAPFSYSWNTTPVQTTATATGLGAGTYIASVTDANGCVLTATATITQPSALIASVTTTASACSTVANGTATVTASGGVGPYTYSWNTTPAQTNPTIAGLIQGSYTVTVRDANNCAATASAVVPAGAGVTGSFTRTASPYCFGGSNGTATFTPTGGTAPYTYLWSNGQATATAGGLAAGSWNVTVTDVNGCSYKDTFILTQPTALQATVQVTMPGCFGGQDGTAAVTVSGGGTPYTYSWNTTPVQTTATATGLAAGNYRVTIRDANNCTFTRTATVQQPTLLSVSVGTQNATCSSQANGKAYATPSGGTAPYTYAWNTTPVQTKDTAKGLLAGTYTVTVTDSKGCTAIQTVSLSASPGVSASISIVRTPCVGATDGILQGAATGGVMPYTWRWSTTPVQTTQTASGLRPATYKLTVTDASQCVDTLSLALPAAPLPVVSAGTDKTICGAKPVVLDGSGTATTWNWSPAAGLSCTTCLNPASTSTINRDYVLTGTDANGCQNKDTVSVRAVRYNAVSVGPKQKICEGEAAVLAARGGTRYSWTPTATLSDSTTAAPVARPDTTTKYRVVIYQDICFVDTLYQEVEVYKQPYVSLPDEMSAFYGSRIEIPAVVDHAPFLQWTPTDGLNCSDCVTPTALITGPITYILTATNAAGCTASDSVVIVTNCDAKDYFLPTAFMPEGNEDVRWFYPQGKTGGNIRSIKIFDRWGTLVFEAGAAPLNTPNAGWDGRYQGNYAPQGVYVYILEAPCVGGRSIQITGNVTLMR